MTVISLYICQMTFGYDGIHCCTALTNDLSLPLYSYKHSLESHFQGCYEALYGWLHIIQNSWLSPKKIWGGSESSLQAVLVVLVLVLVLQLGIFWSCFRPFRPLDWLPSRIKTWTFPLFFWWRNCAVSVPQKTSYYDKAGVEIIIMSDILQIIHISQ